VRCAAALAEAEGAALVEVEHLLRALVDPPVEPVGRALVDAGITSVALRDALDREFRSALALVGVTTSRPSPASAPRLRRGRATPFAPSATLALQRTLEVALASGERRITNRHLVVAMTGTTVGVMPRLLRELGTTAEAIQTAIGR
jgi:ATP-dependent Clp protease ATP-binding subunit ClpA